MVDTCLQGVNANLPVLNGVPVKRPVGLRREYTERERIPRRLAAHALQIEYQIGRHRVLESSRSSY